MISQSWGFLGRNGLYFKFKSELPAGIIANIVFSNGIGFKLYESTPGGWLNEEDYQDPMVLYYVTYRGKIIDFEF